MTGAEFQAIREQHGWTRIQICRALHYCNSAVSDWEHSRLAVPPPVAAWAAALPVVPVSGAYPPTRGGLRLWYLRHEMNCRDVGEFVGVAEHTVWRWLEGASPVPLGVQAWLRAGTPPAWLWAPPGWDGEYPRCNVISQPGKPLDSEPQRRTGHTRRIGSWVARRAHAAQQPRPARRKAAVA